MKTKKIKNTVLQGTCPVGFKRVVRPIYGEIDGFEITLDGVRAWVAIPAHPVKGSRVSERESVKFLAAFLNLFPGFDVQPSDESAP